MSSGLLDPFRRVTERVDNFNEMLLNRMRRSSQRAVDVVMSPFFIRWLPLFLISCLTLYILIGSLAFYIIEDARQEDSVRTWKRNMEHHRKRFAHKIVDRIFNDTKSLFVIIDPEKSVNIKRHLEESLSLYERGLSLKRPQESEWSFHNSFCYAYSLLLTLGHGAKIPERITGQVFTLFYALIGIPLFYSTLVSLVFKLVQPILQKTFTTPLSRITSLFVLKLFYIVWNFNIACILYNFVFVKSFWKSVFTAFISGLTVQIPYQQELIHFSYFYLLLANTVTAAIAIACLIVLASIICPQSQCFQPEKRHQPLSDRTEPLAQPQKFTIIVDEAGESKLTEAR